MIYKSRLGAVAAMAAAIKPQSNAVREASSLALEIIGVVGVAAGMARHRRRKLPNIEEGTT